MPSFEPDVCGILHQSHLVRVLHAPTTWQHVLSALKPGCPGSVLITSKSGCSMLCCSATNHASGEHAACIPWSISRHTRTSAGCISSKHIARTVHFEHAHVTCPVSCHTEQHHPCHTSNMPCVVLHRTPNTPTCLADKYITCPTPPQ